MVLAFSKYQGSGNDFILIDDRSHTFPLEEDGYIRALCQRNFGIGADGLIALQHSSIADIRMRIFNADGREASFCGNGLRCLALYAKKLGIYTESALVETRSSVVPVFVEPDGVETHLPLPKVVEQNLWIQGVCCSIVDAGVLHAVSIVEDLSIYPVEEMGRKIRHHPLFAPDGVNVNFTTYKEGVLHIRTYERGVEAQTLSCGSGAAAAAYLYMMQRKDLLKIQVQPLSQSPLVCSISEGSSHMRVKGSAQFVFSGNI